MAVITQGFKNVHVTTWFGKGNQKAYHGLIAQLSAVSVHVVCFAKNIKIDVCIDAYTEPLHPLL